AGSQSSNACCKNPLMVESEIREAPGSEPLDVGGVSGGVQLDGVAADKGKVGHCDYPLPGIAVRIAERVQLLQEHFFDSGFLAHFTHSSLFKGLVLQDESAGERPPTAKWLDDSLDQGDLELTAHDCEDQNVDRYRWAFRRRVGQFWTICRVSVQYTL